MKLPTRLPGSPSAILAAAALLLPATAGASGLVSLNLDLLPSVPGVNQFETVFSAVFESEDTPGVPIVFAQSTETVRYEDEPEKTGLRIELDVDVSNRFNPLVNTIRFVGEIGDINHSLNDPPIELGVAPGDTLTGTPSGVGSLIRTNGLPRIVNSNGLFEASQTTFVVAEGSVAVEGIATFPIGGGSTLELDFPPGFALNFAQDTAETSAQLSPGLVNSVDVNFDRVQNGQDIYSVRVEAPLVDSLTRLVFDQPGLGTFGLDLLVNGTLIGEGEFAASSIGPAPGDYDGDGFVTAGDYSIWRGAVGSSLAAADGLGDGTIDELDYQIWRRGFEPSAAAVSATAVPEPTNLAGALLLLGVLAGGGHRLAVVGQRRG